MAIKKTNAKLDAIKYDVLEDYLVAERNGGYTVRLRYISWNDRDPVYDIRTWKVRDDGTEICGKGLTVSGEELEALGEVIGKL